MQTTSDLRRSYNRERGKLTFDALPRLDKQGLALGRGTRLVRFDRLSPGRVWDRDVERSIVLLATVHQKLPLFFCKQLSAPSIVGNVAIQLWRISSLLLRDCLGSKAKSMPFVSSSSRRCSTRD